VFKAHDTNLPIFPNRAEPATTAARFAPSLSISHAEGSWPSSCSYDFDYPQSLFRRPTAEQNGGKGSQGLRHHLLSDAERARGLPVGGIELRMTASDAIASVVEHTTGAGIFTHATGAGIFTHATGAGVEDGLAAHACFRQADAARRASNAGAATPGTAERACGGRRAVGVGAPVANLDGARAATATAGAAVARCAEATTGQIGLWVERVAIRIQALTNTLAGAGHDDHPR